MIRRIEALELKEHTQVNQVSTSTCNECNATDHTIERYPFLMGPIKNEVAQVNAAYQRPINASMHQPTTQDGGTTPIFLGHKYQTQIDLPSLSPTPDPLNYQITHQILVMIKGLTHEKRV